MANGREILWGPIAKVDQAEAIIRIVGASWILLIVVSFLMSTLAPPTHTIRALEPANGSQEEGAQVGRILGVILGGIMFAGPGIYLYVKKSRVAAIIISIMMFVINLFSVMNLAQVLNFAIIGHILNSGDQIIALLINGTKSSLLLAVGYISWRAVKATWFLKDNGRRHAPEIANNFS